MSAPCECEHIDHFDDVGGALQCHPYGEEVEEHELVELPTPHGPFMVCASCRRNHLTAEVLDA